MQNLQNWSCKRKYGSPHKLDYPINKEKNGSKKAGTAGIGRMGLFSARLVHFFLCSIYGVKNEHQKNMPQLRRYVASSLVPLRPKVIKYGLRFLK